MAFSEIEIERIKKLVGSFCKTRVPEELRSEVSLDYELKAHTITIYEVRPKWNNPHEIKRKAFARIRWVQMRKIWNLFWLKADLKWHTYTPLSHAPHLDQIIAEISTDPHGCFFG